MTPRLEALLRLLAVQAAWTYERMSGIGVGHASAPLLRDLYSRADPAARRAAVARSASFFNSHPYLAGVAVGAVVRAERDGTAPDQIVRLRTALSGPLGSLGDQLVWAGQVPALMGLALATAPSIGMWTVAGVLLLHNVARLWLTAWGLDLGLREGLRVGAALQRSWIARRASDAQRLAAFAVGLGVPLAAWHLLREESTSAKTAIVCTSFLGVVVVLSPAARTHLTGLRIGLALIAAAIIAIGGTQ